MLNLQYHSVSQDNTVVCTIMPEWTLCLCSECRATYKSLPPHANMHKYACLWANSAHNLKYCQNFVKNWLSKYFHCTHYTGYEYTYKRKFRIILGQANTVYALCHCFNFGKIFNINLIYWCGSNTNVIIIIIITICNCKVKCRRGNAWLSKQFQVQGSPTHQCVRWHPTFTSSSSSSAASW